MGKIKLGAIFVNDAGINGLLEKQQLKSQKSVLSPDYWFLLSHNGECVESLRKGYSLIFRIYLYNLASLI